MLGGVAAQLHLCNGVSDDGVEMWRGCGAGHKQPFAEHGIRSETGLEQAFSQCLLAFFPFITVPSAPVSVWPVQARFWAMFGL